MDYLHIDPRLDEHPDCEEAGFAAVAVFQAVLRAVARNDGHGRLRGKFAAPWWLVRRMNLSRDDIGDREPEAWVAKALGRLVQVGLLERDGTDYVVPGWEKFYPPKQTNAERQAEYRRRRTGENATATPVQAVTDVTSVTTRDNSNATPHHSTPLNSTEKKHVRAVPASDGQEEAGQLQEVWNRWRPPELSEWVPPTGKTRRRLARDALKRHPLPEWENSMAKLAGSDFCRGLSGTGWRADPDWWLRPDGKKPEPHQKLLEGAYDNPPLLSGPGDSMRGRPRFDPNGGILRGAS